MSVLSPGAYSKAVAISLFFLLLLVVPQLFVPALAEIATEVPIVVGWGGTRLSENVAFNETNPPSTVFLGEKASNQEVQARTIVEKGLNALRVSFAPHCIPDPDEFMSPYNSTRLERSFRIAETLGMWIIVDYHGYREMTNSTVGTCWLEFWSPIVVQFRDRYDRTIWEPLNEPSGLSGNVTQLSYWYQRWINETRALGDTHWIVVQNLCSFGCTLDWADGFPAVIDPLEKTFISIHPYMSYRTYHSSWDSATAENLADRYYQAMLDGASRRGQPILNTEGGMGRVSRSENGTEVYCPDLVLRGSAGYCRTSFHFAETLTRLLDYSPPQRVNWVWWPIGDWTDTPGAGVLGALAPDGWGSLLGVRVVVRDVAVTGVFTAATSIVQGETVSVTATVENQGDVPESFDAVAEFNDTAISVQHVLDLGPGVSHTIEFSWDTTWVTPGTYLIVVMVFLNAGERDTVDNARVGGHITVEASAVSPSSPWWHNYWFLLLLGVGATAVAVSVLKIHTREKPKRSPVERR